MVVNSRRALLPAPGLHSIPHVVRHRRRQMLIPLQRLWEIEDENAGFNIFQSTAFTPRTIFISILGLTSITEQR